MEVFNNTKLKRMDIESLENKIWYGKELSDREQEEFRLLLSKALNPRMDKFTAVKKRPFFSLIMPVYNRPQFLDDAIRSVLSQSFRNFELLLIDDGSTNLKTITILKRYHQPPLIRLISRPINGGSAAAMNTGLSFAKGLILGRIDSDDVLLPNALKIMKLAVDEYPEDSYFYSSRITIDENNIPLRKFESVPFSPQILHRYYIAKHFICWRKKDLLEVGGFDENLFSGEDYDLALRMSTHFHFVPKILYASRVHKEGRITDLTSEEELRELSCLIQKRYYIKGGISL